MDGYRPVYTAMAWTSLNLRGSNENLNAKEGSAVDDETVTSGYNQESTNVGANENLYLNGEKWSKIFRI